MSTSADRRHLLLVPVMVLLLSSASWLGAPAQAQVTPLHYDQGATGLGLALRHLPVDGGVLYVTAHPDDENNGLLVKLNRGLGLRTALLTVTRGDGGQNEIGPELFQAIGILRTEELANVHRYDGAEQYFTRAFEFGYSFSVEETFEKWNREAILEDVVRVVRTFRPDVIITMPREGPGGGQHHQATARLGHEAFRAAADPNRFPGQIQEGLRPWQARKVYQTAGGRNQAAPEGAVLDVTSDYDPLLGMSWNQLGALARAAHRCQGMGQLEAQPGEGQAAHSLVDSEPKVTGTETGILEAVDTSLSRWAEIVKGEQAAAGFLKAGIEAIEAAAQQASKAFDVRTPHETLEPLAAGLKAVRDLQSKVKVSSLSKGVRDELAFRLVRKEADFQKALALAQGLAFSVTADDGDVVPGQGFGVVAQAWNQSAVPVTIDDIALRLPEGWTQERTEGEPGKLAPGQGVTVKYRVTVGEQARYSQPYWKRNFDVDRFDIEIPEHHTLPWSPPRVVAELRYTVDTVPAVLEQAAYWRYEGPWVGAEKRKVVNVVPALSVALKPALAVIPLKAAGSQREFRVSVLSNATQAATAKVRLEAPDGWVVEPEEVPVAFQLEGEEATARFFVTPPPGLAAGELEIRAVATQDGREFREGYQVIAYDHIQKRHLYHPAASAVKAVDVKLGDAVSIGYVLGAGDEVPPAIEGLGAPLTFLTPDDIAFGDLSEYTTIVTGIRAYLTRSDLKSHHKRLMGYVEGGGHLIVQYNKFEFNQLTDRPDFRPGFNFDDVESPFAPYPAAVTRNRVTVEEAPVRMLLPEHQLLNSPNRITDADFEGWVQERGLYFLGAKDDRYQELFASTDPWPKNAGEKKGILVTTQVGKGTWTYVGLGLWRQLPAGTTGAYRILANLLSQPRGTE